MQDPPSLEYERMTDQTTAIAKTQDNNSFGALLTKYAPEFRKIAPKELNLERVFRLAESARTKNPQLAQCTTASILSCLQEGTKLGLEPVGKHGYYLIPFRNKKTGRSEATMIVDYRGLVELVERGGSVRQGTFASFCIHEKDELEHLEAGAFIHRPKKFDRDKEGNLYPVERGKVVGVYAQVQLKDGTWKKTEPYTVAEIERYREVSRAGKFGPWVDWWDDMAKKTAIRRLCNFLPQSAETKEHLNAMDEIEYGQPIVDVGHAPAVATPIEPPAVDRKLLEALGGQGGPALMPPSEPVEPNGEPAAEPPKNEAAVLRERIAGLYGQCTELWGNGDEVAEAFEAGVGVVKGLRSIEKLTAKLQAAEGLLDKFAVTKMIHQHKQVVADHGGEEFVPVAQPWASPLEKLQELETQWRESRNDTGVTAEGDGAEPAEPANPEGQPSLGLDEPPVHTDDDADVPWG